MAYRLYPQISLIPLAEYLHASASRRWSIIQDHAKPSDEVVPQYRRAYAAARRYLRSGGRNAQILEGAIRELGEAQARTLWQKRDLANSAEALRRLLSTQDLHLGTRVLRTRQGGIMMLGGVRVSVNPTVAVLAGDRVGAVKLFFRKGRSLSETEAEYATTLLRVFVQERLEGLPQSVDPQLCQVVDVWRGRVFMVPTAFKRRLTTVLAACEEVARMWPGAAPVGPTVDPKHSPVPLH